MDLESEGLKSGGRRSTEEFRWRGRALEFGNSRPREWAGSVDGMVEVGIGTVGPISMEVILR